MEYKWPYTKQILPMTSCCVVSDNGRTPDSGNLAASRHVLRETCIPYTSLTTLTYLGAWVTRVWLVTRDRFGWCGYRWCSTVWSLLKFTTCITRTLTWGSLKDNSVCCQIFWTALLDLAAIASKVTRVRTPASMLAAAPLASSMLVHD